MVLRPGLVMANLNPLRSERVTASFLNSLMAGNNTAILNKWRELVGDPQYQPEDLSDSWPAQLGLYLEPFALDWHQRKTGRPLTRRGEFVQHPDLSYVSCTLDAFRDDDRCAIDVKAPGSWMRLDEVIPYYTPQLICQVRCTNAAAGALLIAHGGAEPREFPVDIDPGFEALLWERAAQFWHCVETFTPPVPLPRLVPPEKWRSIDLATDHPNWRGQMIAALEIWRETKTQAARFEDAKLAVKDLLPDDVGRCDYAGLSIRRARNNAVSIRIAS
jgi:hypothetical protein